MMQKTLFLCVLFVLAAFCPAFAQSLSFLMGEDESSDFGALLFASEDRGMPPLSATEYQGASFDALSRARTVSYRQGKADAEIVFAADGSILHSISYVYTAAGFLSEISCADSLGEPKWAYRYERDEEGKLLRETSVSFAGGQEVQEGAVVSSYDGSGRLSKRETLSAEGQVTLSESFVYDESGRLAEKNSYYGDGTLLKRETCEYAAEADGDTPAGAVKRIRRYDSNGLYETVLLEYKDGRPSAIFRYGSDSVLKDSETLQYSGEKISRRARFNADGSALGEYTRLYDWAGNVAMERDGAGITVWDFVYPKQEP